MKIGLKLGLAALICVGSVFGAAFTNGSFTCPGQAGAFPLGCNFAEPPRYQYIPTGGAQGSVIPGWSIGGDGIVWGAEYNSTTGVGWNTTIAPGDGLHYTVGLQGYNGTSWTVGGISQVFDITPGHSYVMSWLTSGAPSAFNDGRLSVFGAVRLDLSASIPTDPRVFRYTFGAGGNTGANMHWSTGDGCANPLSPTCYGVAFVAGASTTASVSFLSLEYTTVSGTNIPLAGGIVLDGVTLTDVTNPVPEPGTLSMMLGFGLVGLGWAFRRRKQ